MKKKKVAIIGGGPSGMMAAIIAARRGAAATLFERHPRVGKKLLATGNGRCNMTNMDTTISRFHGGDPGFPASALSEFTVAQTMDFFEALGITPRVEEDGKVFPRSGQASSVLDVLRWEMAAQGVEVRCDTEISSLKKSGGLFTLAPAEGPAYRGDSVVLAAGGRATPNLCSHGSGYLLAEQAGHTILEPWPALVPLKLDAGYLKQIKGIKWQGTAAVILDGMAAEMAEGEILFTEYGISGPPILALSRAAGAGALRGARVELKLTLVPEMKPAELLNHLEERFRGGGNREVAFSLVGFINKQLIPVVLKQAGIEDMHRPARSITGPERHSIAQILQDWRFTVTGTTSWPNAQVTVGGISTAEIDPTTMQSLKLPGLYFAGEIMDVDGDCGGFNLQWAWSSGFTAGLHAAV